MRLFRTTFTTPVGPMMALASDDALCALEFWNPGRMDRLESRLRRSAAAAAEQQRSGEQGASGPGEGASTRARAQARCGRRGGTVEGRVDHGRRR